MRFERRWNEREEAIAWEMYLKRKSYAQIGDRLGRSRGSVSTKIRTIKEKKFKVKKRALQFSNRRRFLDEINISERVKEMFRTDPHQIEKERSESTFWSQRFKGFKNGT